MTFFEKNEPLIIAAVWLIVVVGGCFAFDQYRHWQQEKRLSAYDALMKSSERSPPPPSYTSTDADFATRHNIPAWQQNVVSSAAEKAGQDFLSLRDKPRDNSTAVDEVAGS